MRDDGHKITIYNGSTLSSRWRAVCLDLIGSSIVLFAGLFAVLERDTISAGIAGLSVTYALQVQECHGNYKTGFNRKNAGLNCVRHVITELLNNRTTPLRSLPSFI